MFVQELEKSAENVVSTLKLNVRLFASFKWVSLVLVLQVHGIFLHACLCFLD